MEKWVMFYHNEKELGGYTVRGTFAGELEATKELFAYENGIPESEIEVKIIER